LRNHGETRAAGGSRYTRAVARPDPHSAFDDAQPRVRHLDWRVRVDFAARALDCEARLTLERDGNGGDGGNRDGDIVDLDSRDLVIAGIDDGDGNRIAFELAPPHPFLGRRLRIACGPARTLRIVYRTSPAAPALQWLNQSVYSQCQPIQARSLVPLPDSPSARLTMRAEVTAPRATTVLMGGAFAGRTEHGEEAVTRYVMDEPIAPYLLALAVGEAAARDLSPRARVWAAPPLLDAAASELAGIERILAAAEALLGPYRWRRFDLWITPPPFPYGGMENPRLTFLSPSLLAGDGSLLGVLVHELAHAWMGNLAGAASAEHIWINEGLAVYIERRLVEALDGAAAAQQQAAIGRRELERALDAFAARPELTRLRTWLADLDPDEVLSIVPYEKGYLFACALEARLGREAFDRLLRGYLERFAGAAVTSEALAAFVAAHAPGFDCDEWLNHSGLPASAPPPPLPTPSTTLPERAEAAAWSPWQWRWYLDGLPRPSPLCATLDKWFNLSRARNCEVRAAWLPLAIESGHQPALVELEHALDGNDPLGGGRIKLLRPLYLALARHPTTQAQAAAWWRRFRDSYHPLARQQLERMLRELGVATHEVNPLSLRRRPA
jgi:aminopeptidase N